MMKYSPLGLESQRTETDQLDQIEKELKLESRSEEITQNITQKK